MEYIIRKIEEKDFLEVAMLYKKLRLVWREYMYYWYTKRTIWKEMKTDEEIIPLIAKKMNQKDSLLLVLEVKNKVIGFIYWTIEFSENEVFKDVEYIVWEIKHLFIDEEYRWNGFSSLLRDELYKWFKDNKVWIVEIWVNQDNPVFSIYQKRWYDTKFCYVSIDF